MMNLKLTTRKKYSLEEVMTVSEACSRYNVTLDELKNRIKPSRIGQQEIDSRVSQGIIRKSGNTWLISKDFMELYFNKK